MTNQPTPPDSASASDQWDAIARFLADEGSAGDSAEIRQWLIDHPGDATVVASLEKLLPTTAVESQGEIIASAGTLAFGRPIDVEGALRNVHAKLGLPDAQLPGRHGQPLRGAGLRPAVQPKRRSWITNVVAAAAVLIAAVGLIQGRSRPSATETASVASVYDTPVGRRDSVTLPDGSHVMLDAGSHLVVAANYGKGQRQVELRGAGRFTVKHDAANPFSVRIGSAIVRDLGTVFTVKAVGTSVVVAVTEGSVALSDSSRAGQDAAVELKASDRGRVLADGSVVPERGVVTPNDAAWVVGKLVYRDASFAEVQADLRRWLGVELVVKDSSLIANSVTTDVRTGDPLSTTVAILEGLMGASATTRGDTVYFERAGAAKR